MLELQMTRDPDDKGRWELAGVGSVRFPRRWKNEVVIEAPGRPPWKSNGKALMGKGSPATDPDGRQVALFEAGSARRIVLGGREYLMEGGHALGLAARPPFRLTAEGRDLATFQPQIWGRRPVGVTVLDDQLDPMLLLFAAYAAHLLSNTGRAHGYV